MLTDQGCLTLSPARCSGGLGHSLVLQEFLNSTRKQKSPSVVVLKPLRELRVVTGRLGQRGQQGTVSPGEHRTKFKFGGGG